MGEEPFKAHLPDPAGPGAGGRVLEAVDTVAAAADPRHGAVDAFIVRTPIVLVRQRRPTQAPAVLVLVRGVPLPLPMTVLLPVTMPLPVTVPMLLTMTMPMPGAGR